MKELNVHAWNEKNKSKYPNGSSVNRIMEAYAKDYHEKMTHNKLRLLASWLEESDANIDPYGDGTLEAALKYAKSEVKQEIGGLINELLLMDDQKIIKSLNNINKKKETDYPF